MKLLAIDRGNSRTKVGITTPTGELNTYYFATTDEAGLMDLIHKEQCDAGAMSSVAANHLPSVAAYFHQQKNHILVDFNTPVPIQLEYATPNTLGTDRVAGAVGAWFLAGKKDVLLIDAGTCINYELVLNNTYKGGAIAPGLLMKLRAMHEFTGKLPLLQLEEGPIEFTGDSTKNCMLSGAVWGTVHEIDGIIDRYTTAHSTLSVILTGGDAAYLGKYLKNSIFAPHKPNLSVGREVVITGLIEILKHYLHA